MLKTGKEHLEGLRDGRVVYIGGERVDDVTSHPAFRNAARSVAAIYDRKAAAEQRDAYSSEADGERFSNYYLRATSRDDLRARTRIHKAIADWTHGFFGRSPDHVSSFVTGLAMHPSVLKMERGDFSRNLLDYYHHMRKNDIYTTYAVVPPQASRDPDFYQQQNLPVPTLQVVRETDDGIVINGMKMLATGAILSDEVWIGNLLPLAPDQVKQAVTCAVPCNAPGLSLWSRKPMELNARSEFDNPLSYKYDETDAMLMCDNVKVPWERVFALDDVPLSRAMYVQTPAHCYGNHQSNVRFWAKLQLIVGLCNKITRATGANAVFAVQETLGRMAALEATLAAMIHGQIEAAEDWPAGYKTFNRRMMYAALNWCTENHSAIIDKLRELCGGGVFQMPADASVMHNAETRADFETYWQTPQLSAVDRMKLFRLAWDMVGSEFAGRHQQYEKFYAGAAFVVRGYSFREAPWATFDAVVDDILDGYDVPDAQPPGMA